MLVSEKIHSFYTRLCPATQQQKLQYVIQPLIWHSEGLSSHIHVLFIRRSVFSQTPVSAQASSRSQRGSTWQPPEIRSKQRDPNPKDTSLTRKDTSTYQGFHSTFRGTVFSLRSCCQGEGPFVRYSLRLWNGAPPESFFGASNSARAR